MEPIAGSYRIRCRMSSSCLTYFVVPPSYPVRLPAVSSFPVACLLLACLVFSRFPICLVPPLYSPGGTIWRCASALFAITTIVWMSCDGRAAAGSSVRLRHACPSPRCSTRMAGRGTGRRCLLLSDFYRLPLSLACGSDWSGLFACSYVIGRISSAMRDFCGSRHCGCRGCFAVIYLYCVVREDEHGIGSSGFLSLVFLTRFPLRLTPTSSLVSTLIATTGVLLILSLRPITHGSLLSTRLASSALPMADGARCFYAYYFYGKLVKTTPTDTMISNRQSNQCPCLVLSLSPSLVSAGGAGRLLLALRCLISSRFCIIPVRSGIEHFFRNYMV